jgi:hypothetical protein
MSEGTCRVVIGRVIPLFSVCPNDNIKPSDSPTGPHDESYDDQIMQGAVTLRKSKLHQKLREFLFHSSRFPILPVNVFIVSVLASLELLSPQNIGMIFLLREEGCNTLCYGNPNQFP